MLVKVQAKWASMAEKGKTSLFSFLLCHEQVDVAAPKSYVREISLWECGRGEERKRKKRRWKKERLTFFFLVSFFRAVAVFYYLEGKTKRKKKELVSNWADSKSSGSWQGYFPPSCSWAQGFDRRSRNRYRRIDGICVE